MKFSLLTLVFFSLSFVTSAYSNPKTTAMELGKAKYLMCSACHGMDGKGLQISPGMLMAPAYAESTLVDSPEAFALLLLKGIAKEGADFMGVMAPLEAALNDEDMAAVMTYVRNTYRGHDDVISPSQVEEWRSKYADRKEPVTRAELQELVE
ncbi:MAG: cytochrome c [Verrucomicrobiales bacterium]|nr:cytochrome c [Verrucomicrobiales bacterium]